jgi:hypothetical protein
MSTPAKTAIFSPPLAAPNVNASTVESDSSESFLEKKQKEELSIFLCYHSFCGSVKGEIG